MNLKPALYLLSGTLATAAFAQDPAPMSSDELVENWGRVKYCQKAMAAPQNQTRVYGYDTESCKNADEYMRSLTMAYDPKSRQNLDAAAEHRAKVIISGTRDVTWVLGACRETCAEWVARSRTP